LLLLFSDSTLIQYNYITDRYKNFDSTPFGKYCRSVKYFSTGNN
jgi:hypothetical protein